MSGKKAKSFNRVTRKTASEVASKMFREDFEKKFDTLILERDKLYEIIRRQDKALKILIVAVIVLVPSAIFIGWSLPV